APGVWAPASRSVDIGTVEVAEAAAELTAAGKIITVAGGHGRGAQCRRRGRAVHLCLDRRRRLPRMAGGQAVAGGRGAQGSLTDDTAIRPLPTAQRGGKITDECANDWRRLR